MPPPDVSAIFMYHGRKGNQFYESELKDLLCPQPRQGETPLAFPLSLNSGVSLKNETASYDFKLEKSPDGKTITLNARLQRDGETHQTEMTAKRVKDDLYEITALTFDNHKEKLSYRWELTKVLAHIGQKQLQTACRNTIPLPHRERGKFGKIARFFDRCIPDDLTAFTVPPC
jgi:hypothetical protein